jgi:PAS domain S-box-containing protein
LSADESLKGHPVRVSGVVTHYYWRSGLLVVQDSTGGVPVDASKVRLSVAPGDVVEIDGVTAPGDSCPVVIRPRVSLRGRGVLPAPRPVSAHDLASGREDYRWVEAFGIVRAARVQPDTRLHLAVASPDGSFSALVAGYAESEFAALVDATVRVRGVAHAAPSAGGEAARAELLVPDLAHVTVLEPAPPDPFATSVRPIRTLRAGSPGQAAGHRVRVRGVVAGRTPHQGLVVRDDTGEIDVRPSQMIAVEPGEHVDVVGFLPADPSVTALEEATLRRVPAARSRPSAAGPETGARPAGPGGLRVLTSAAQLRALSADDAARGYPVRLRAVVTYYDPQWAVLFVQDRTAGIYVDANGVKSFAARAGDVVEVEGLSDPGGFVPQVVKPRVRVLGPGTLPADPGLSLEELFSGSHDSQWVEAEGVVQSWTSEDGRHAWLDVVSGLYRFRVHTADVTDLALLDDLVDARVRVRGACATLCNERGQLVGIHVFVPDLDLLRVLRPGTRDPFSAPVRPIASLLRFNPDREPGRRVRVRGVVTLHRPRGLAILDDTGGLFVETTEDDSAGVGDRVEAVGFATPGELAPVLRAARLRKAGDGPPPVPIAVTAADVLSGSYEARLVRIRGRLLDHTRRAGEAALTLQGGQSIFTALLPGQPAEVLDVLRDGSLVEVTGVCSAQGEIVRNSVVPRSFHVFLRSPADIAVVEAAPWWTPRNARAAGGVLAGGLLAALAWAGALRRRVRAQTDRIQRDMVRQSALERHYADLFDNARDVVFEHDLAGRIRSMNRAGERLTGYSREECLAMDVFQLAAPEHRQALRDAIERAASEGASSTYEVEWIARDARRLTLEVSARPVHDDGVPAGIEAIARDVTERKHLEAQFRQAQKMEAVGRLAGGVAHDFNNLLGVITGYGELMRRQVGTGQARTRLEEIMKAAERAAGLTRQLLAFSRKQILRPRLLDLNEIVADLGSMLQRVVGEDVVIETRGGEELGAVEADAGQVEQVIMNLVVNARDAMPRGGRLTIRTANVELDAAFAASHPPATPGRYVLLEVSDTGIGMDAVTRRHVFEPFFTTKPDGNGTGLGLATVYGIVKQSGGYIFVDSEEGRGATFEIYLPRVDQTIAVAPAAAPAETPAGSETVLLVEDEDALRALIRETLEMAGYTVLEARRPSDALRLCAEPAARIDLVLTDVVMPEMSGPELVARLARLLPEAKVLFMSGYPDGFLARHGALDPGTLLIEKPFTSDALARALRDVLDGRAEVGASAVARAS